MRRPGLLCLTIILLGMSTADASDELRQNVQRIFGSQALEERSFGPARWIRGGASFTTVEPSAADPKAREIVEYDTATGKRSPMITVAQLTPSGGKEALDVEDYS